VLWIFFGQGLAFLPRWAWTVILVPTASSIAGITGVYHHTGLVGWDRVSLTFCPGWPWISTPPISASRVARIIDVKHCAQRPDSFFSFLLLFYHFYIYLHAYTLFVPPAPAPTSPQPQLLGRTCSALFSLVMFFFFFFQV
jgi:hypothetical protein